MKQTILIAGGSGLIGQYISRALSSGGHEVRWLSRRPASQSAYPAFQWDPAQKQADPAALEGVTVIINLAGEGIADKRWTKQRKQQIIRSRVDANTCIEHLILTGQVKPDLYLSAAAMGYYGHRGNRWVHEDDPAGSTGFLPRCCVEWENAIQGVASTGVRTAWFRIGLVLAREGGAFPALRRPFRFGLGTYFGDKDLYLSWIHIEDLAGMFVHAILQSDMEGAYNAAAPQPVKSKDMGLAIRKSLRMPSLLIHAPVLPLKFILGEMAEVLLSGARMATDKIRNAGFRYRFEVLEKAIADLN